MAQSITLGAGLTLGAIVLSIVIKTLRLFPPYYEDIEARGVQVRNDKIRNALVIWAGLSVTNAIIELHWIVTESFYHQTPPELALVSEIQAAIAEVITELYPELLLEYIGHEPTSSSIVLAGAFALLLWRVSYGLAVLLMDYPVNRLPNE